MEVEWNDVLVGRMGLLIKTSISISLRDFLSRCRPSFVCHAVLSILSLVVASLNIRVRHMGELLGHSQLKRRHIFEKKIVLGKFVRQNLV